MTHEEMNKECSRCWTEKPLTEFTPQPSGKYGRHSYCRECMRAYRSRWNQTEKGKASIKKYTTRRKDTWLVELNASKIAKGCIDCGYNEGPHLPQLRPPGWNRELVPDSLRLVHEVAGDG